MAVKFVPEELKEELKQLLDFFEEHEIQHDFDGYLSNDYKEEDTIIDKDTAIQVWLPRTDYEESSTLGDVIEMVREALKARQIDEYKFIGKRLALFRIDSYSREMLSRAAYELPTTITESAHDQEYELNIVAGLTSYAFKLVIDQMYSKYVPPVDFDDIFIEISCEDKLDEEVLESLVEAYLFELKSTIGIEVHPSPRVFYDPWEEEDVQLEAALSRLRPLLRGKGVPELLKLYNSSLSTQNAEILILTYTKVIEYVSQTVIQQDLIRTVSKKLSSPKALSPDANYILELSKIFEGNRNHKKDHLAIKLTVETCCDLLEIVSNAPQFLKFTRKLTMDSKPEDLQRALDEVANAISNTRNMLAHAKTNYEKKGKECPEDQLDDFAKCLDILAQQIIRWFAREHEDNRVV
ncbi:hypothetical protein [Ectobacillus funiculus]|uniref:hypothetical protein n=1 Tax=Ectobacillus funiculus TaxID=137993 RepID=UPI00101D7094|nr:hypothetical protein [Ectobacillus funiculus]